MKTALIIGIGGMDGSYMGELLLSKGYKVFGMERKHSIQTHSNAKHLEDKITFLYGDLLDQDSLLKCLNDSNPDEVYNLAGQSSPAQSWASPQYASEVNAMGVLRLLESIRTYNRPIKFFQSSSSEMFGKITNNIERCTETTPFFPQNPYAVSKLFAHSITKMYREAYNMFNCTAISYNHESERRGIDFLTRKITNGVAKIHLGLSDSITLGNIEIKKDWGYSPEFCLAYWLIMQQDKSDDYIVATGKSHSIKEFLQISFECVGIYDWEKYIKQDKRYIRPTETNLILGDYSKIKERVNWEPKISFKDMIERMVKNDIEILKNKISKNELIKY